MTKNKIKSLIKKILREEFLEEMSGTAAASGGLGPPQVPHAFAGKDEEKTVGWKGEEFGVDSMPNPDKRRTNKVDQHDPGKLHEMVVKQQPSSSSHITFPISKEIKDFEDSIKNYKKSEMEKFISTLKGKLEGKSAKFIARKGSVDPNVPAKSYVCQIKDIKPYQKNGVFYVVIVSDSSNYFMSSDLNKKMLIYGDEENPVTDRLQNKPQMDKFSQNTVKI